MPLFESIRNLAFFSTIRESSLAYPVILATHLSCIAIFGGAILMTDLRLLGLAMTDQPASDVLVQFRNWKRIGFVMMAASGLLLAGSKAETYYANPYFLLKLVLLALVGMHALAFRRRVHRAPKLAACLSLALWLGIVSCGRLIAYYEPDAKGSVAYTVPHLADPLARLAPRH